LADRPTALVTGASSGIGADLARELARNGHDLVLVARRGDALERLARELARDGVDARAWPLDLAMADAADLLAARLRREAVHVDVLVNNAGFGDARSFHAASPEKLARMLRLNIEALTTLTRLLLPPMLERGHGRIMLLGSVAGFQPGPGMAVYCASKAYVLSLGEALAEEVRGTGVTVTTLCPGTTATGFAAAAGAENRRLFKSSLVPVMASADVAARGYRALAAGRRVVVTGLHNKLSAALTRLVPRRLLLPLTRALFERD
jgi:short-subunit dehydrogenase